MRPALVIALAAGLVTTGLSACRPPSCPPVELPVTLIPLAGDVAEAKAEISGLAWHGDDLILLPQYPKRTKTKEHPGGFLYAIPKAEILALLEGRAPGPLTPRPIPFDGAGLDHDIAGFEGFEAIAFDGDRVVLTIESEKKHAMSGHLVAGTIAPELGAITLDPARRAEIPAQAPLNNTADESVALAGATLFTLYEANGATVNPQPVAHRFDRSLAPLDPIPMARLEYRVTDATELDAAGRFWVINSHDPTDTALYQPAPDALAEAFGEGPTHTESASVERLVELAYTEHGIEHTGTPPIQLQLLGGDVTRNWEGLVRLDDRGFLLATDKAPDTLLGFVPLPGGC